MSDSPSDNSALSATTAPSDGISPWIVVSVILAVIGHVVNLITLYLYFRTGLNGQLLLISSLLLTVVLAIGSAYILRARVQGKNIGSKGHNKPVYAEGPRYTNSALRRVSKISLIVTCSFLVAGSITYLLLRYVQPRQTIILVADFTAPDGANESGVDVSDVTRRVYESIQEVVAEHDSIAVRRMYFPIPNRDGKGSERARQKGLDPWWRGSIVIWGDYVVQPAPELNVRFEILRSDDTYLASGLGSTLRPNTVDFLNFRVDLGRALGELAAFSTALALFEDDQNLQAIPLFNTAVGIIDTPEHVAPLITQLTRAVRYFRGTNYLTLGRALEAGQDLGAVVGNPNDMREADELWLAALGNFGLVAMYQGNYPVARDYLQRSLDLAIQMGDPLGQADQLGNLGAVAASQGDYPVARDYLQRALDLHTQLGNPLGQANQLGNLGAVAIEQGNYPMARDYLQRSLDLAIQLSNPLGEATQLGNLGLIAKNQGDYPAARDYHQRSLVLHTQLGQPLGEANQMGNLGLVALLMGDYPAARDYLQRSLDLAIQMGNPLGQANQLGNLGIVASDLGDYPAARDYHQRALDLHTELGNPLGQANQLGNLGRVAMDQDDYPAARDYLQRSLELHIQLGNPLGQGQTLGNLGNMAMDLGDYPAASAYYQQALDLHTQMGNPLGQAAGLGNLGNVAMLQDDYAAARDYMQRSLDLHTQLGNPLGQAVDLANLGLLDKRLGNIEAACTALRASAAFYRQIGLAVHPSVQKALDELSCPEE